MTDNQAPIARSESREIAELRRLKEENPDLASAADLQIGVRGRVGQDIVEATRAARLTST